VTSYDPRRPGKSFVLALLGLFRQAGEDPPDDQYLARVGYAAKRSGIIDERTQVRIAARIVERWPEVRLSFKQALADVREEEEEEERDERFPYTKADEMRLVERRSARKWKQREEWHRQWLESQDQYGEET
jgi:hypothetical protein